MTSASGINHEEVAPAPFETEWKSVSYDFHKPYRDLLARVEDICSTGDAGRAVLIRPIEEYYLCAVFPEEGPRLVGKIRLLQARFIYRTGEKDGI